MALRPLGHSFLFSFLNETSQGRFIERNSGVVILTNQNYNEQGTQARWGKVLAIGSDVTDFNVGDYVLIEALQWTIQLKHEGVQYWKSDDSKVMAVTDDEQSTYAF